MSRYRSLPYHGGKRGYGKGEWIASNLPWERQSTYVEPFAGMLGVLLARRPVKIELVNDLNERVVNWWRAVRDQPQEFAHLVENTPYSRAEFLWAEENLDNPDIPPIRRALAFHVKIQQGFMHGDGGTGWSVTMSSAVGNRGLFRGESIIALADRIRAVQLECRDATDILKRIAGFQDAVVYADPPYPTADTSPYTINQVDMKALADLFQAQKGAVAVSGYGSEWDMLGWARVEMACLRRQIKNNSEPRTEVLWLNEKAARVQPQMNLEVVVANEIRPDNHRNGGNPHPANALGLL